MTWLHNISGRDEAYWVGRIQTLIRQKFTDTPDGHLQGNIEDWLHPFIDEVLKTFPSDGHFDGNMRICAMLSAILGLWYSQIQWSKCQDNHRPVRIRQEGYARRQDWARYMFDVLTDFSGAPTFFPGQPWEFPFDPEAKNGDFV